jgi:hypothetical protein
MVDRELARIATRAHGVVTRAQLLAAGISADEIKHRQRTGALIPQHRGVYRVGHRAPSVEARYLAAVLACGEGAVLSGRAAGWLLGLLRGSAPAPEVTAPTEGRVRGVARRRSRAAVDVERTVWRGIAVTTVARTLVDMASQFGRDELRRFTYGDVFERPQSVLAEVSALLGRRA